MTAPITGPIIAEAGDRHGTFYSYTYGYRQKKPYNVNLNPHKRLFGGVNGTWPGALHDVLTRIDGYTRPDIDNAAYSRFIGKMKAQNASLGVTLGEQQAARKMMTARSKQLLAFSTALVRRDFRRAYKVMRQDFPSKGFKAQPKHLANLYLEYSWGWRPMVQDIQDCLATLVDPVVPIYVRSANTGQIELGDPPIVYTGFAFGPPPDYVGYWYRQEWKTTWTGPYKVATGASIEVSNPNVALANRLGVLNIPQIIWQVQPFSFIVDKYLNIGQMIGSLTDTYGFTLSDTWTSRRVSAVVKLEYAEYRDYGSGAELTAQSSAVVNATAKNRVGGLLGPTLALRNPSIGSLSEAASYIALLYQILSK